MVVTIVSKIFIYSMFVCKNCVKVIICCNTYVKI